MDLIYGNGWTKWTLDVIAQSRCENNTENVNILSFDWWWWFLEIGIMMTNEKQEEADQNQRKSIMRKREKFIFFLFFKKRKGSRRRQNGRLEEWDQEQKVSTG